MKVTWPVEDALEQRSLGKYNLIASLGQGGMAKVYLAVVAGPGSFHKLLVVKALRPDAQGSAEFLKMFLDEARLSARFNHPNIVQTYEVGEAYGRYFIAMEYLEGQTLRAVQRKLSGAFPLEEELRVIAETARGLHYAHESRDYTGTPLQVVHRDVSPQNVFLTYDGQVKLLDFGIAKALDSEHLTQVGLIKGKVDYIAPEQARGDHVDRRADIFSLGAMTWEAVTRQRFAGNNVAAVTKLHRRLSGGEPDVLDIQPETPEKLVTLIRRALALDPAHRFDTAAAFAAEVDGFLEAMNFRPSAASLGERLARPFAAERARIRATVEEELKRLGDTSARPSSIPSIERSDTTLSRSGILASASELAAVGSNDPATEAFAKRRWLGTRSAKLGALAGIVAVGGVLGLIHRQSATEEDPSRPVGPPAATPAAPAAIPPPEAAATRATPDTVQLDLSVLPRHARVSLDGEQVPKLPFHASLQKDTSLHHIEASAAGYLTKKLVIPFDADQRLLITLQRDTRPLARNKPRSEERREPRGEERPAAPATTSRLAAGADRPTDPAPGTSLVSKRRIGVSIDKTDPYAK